MKISLIALILFYLFKISCLYSQSIDYRKELQYTFMDEPTFHGKDSIDITGYLSYVIEYDSLGREEKSFLYEEIAGENKVYRKVVRTYLQDSVIDKTYDNDGMKLSERMAFSREGKEEIYSYYLGEDKATVLIRDTTLKNDTVITMNELYLVDADTVRFSYQKYECNSDSTFYRHQKNTWIKELDEKRYEEEVVFATRSVFSDFLETYTQIQILNGDTVFIAAGLSSKGKDGSVNDYQITERKIIKPRLAYSHHLDKTESSYDKEGKIQSWRQSHFWKDEWVLGTNILYQYDEQGRKKTMRETNRHGRVKITFYVYE